MKVFLLFLAPLLGWLTLFAQVLHYWGEGSYYAYGWAVPFLALILGLRRLRDPILEERSAESSVRPIVLLALLMALLIPFRLLAEPDPYWRLTLWLQAAVIIMVTLLCLRLSLGRGAYRAFLFPCLFTLTSLPWPTFAEGALVYTLTGWVTAIDAEILLLSGQPAQVVSNFIQVAGDRIEIDATCSGIRSFQCLLAFGLFFGEYFRLRWGPRCIVALFGLVFAFGFNLLRAIVLSFFALEAEPATYDTWHDSVGHLAVALAFLALLLFARFVSRFNDPPEQNPKAPRLAPVGSATTALVLLLAILPEATTQAWFRYGVTERQVPDWTVDWSAVDQDKLSFLPFRKTTIDALLFDDGKRAILELEDGSLAEIFFYEYDGSRPAASVCSRHHNPSICMAATAANLAGGNESTTIPVGKASLRFIQYVAGQPDFRGHHPLHAFWCPWTPDTRSGAAHYQDLPRSERIRNFLSGRIDFARKVLLVIIQGHRPTKEAETTMKTLVSSLLRPLPN
ncbi:MAG: exosortase/archaeosortase family protein [Opitutales bacterium]